MSNIPKARGHDKPSTAIVVGAGIVGSCIAYRLAKDGVGVTLMEALAPHAGASGGSWAWINAMAAMDKPYYDLRKAGIAAWHELEQELSGTLPLDWSGALVWDSTLIDPDTTGAPSAYGARNGASRRITGSEARTIEPLLGMPPERAILSEEDGLIDAAGATRCLIDAARDAGALYAQGRTVLGLTVEAEAVTGVETDHGSLSADVVVLAAGTGTTEILKSLNVDLPMANKPGLLVTTKPVEARLSKALWSERVHVKQTRDGALVIGENAHAPGALDDPDATATQMLTIAEALLPGLAPLEIARTSIATRPIPRDGLPAIGPALGYEGLHIAVMHSGVTLAAVTARLLARELIEGTTSELLAPYRPSRFAPETHEGAQE